MESIPSDALLDILLQLDLKSLFRSKFVSNYLKNLITSSYFLQLHQKHSALQNSDSNALLIFTLGSSLYIVGDMIQIHNSSPRPNKLALPLSFRNEPNLKLIGSANGLLCIGGGKFLNRYFVINPTNPPAFKMIPFNAQNILSMQYKSAHIMNRHVVSGFGYDEIGDDYKIAYIWDWSDQVGGLLYSSYFGSWKPLNPPPKGDMPWTFSGLLYNSLHFLTEKKRLIYAFDLFDEEWREVYLPDNMDHRHHSYNVVEASVLEGSGCLSVLYNVVQNENNKEKWSELWVMKEYGVGESWTKLMTLPWGTKSALFYSKTLEQYLLKNDEFGLGWYSEQDKKMTSTHIDAKLHLDDENTKMIIGSLVPVETARMHRPS